MADTPLQVELVAADRVVWSGEATMVIARTVDGDVGILANHAPMLSVLVEGTVEVRTTRRRVLGRGGRRRLPVGGRQPGLDPVRARADVPRDRPREGQARPRAGAHGRRERKATTSRPSDWPRPRSGRSRRHHREVTP